MFLKSHAIVRRPMRDYQIVCVDSEPSLLEIALHTQPLDPFDSFETNPFFYPRTSIIQRKRHRQANFPNLFDSHTNLLIRKHSPKRRRVAECSDKIELFVDLPEGMEAKDISLELKENEKILHLTGKTEKKIDGTVSCSRISQMYRLEEHVDTTKISAKLSNQVLQVVIPKLDQVQVSKKIEIVEESMNKENEYKNVEEHEVIKDKEKNASKESVKVDLTQDLEKEKKNEKSKQDDVNKLG